MNGAPERWEFWVMRGCGFGDGACWATRNKQPASCCIGTAATFDSLTSTTRDSRQEPVRLERHREIVAVTTFSTISPADFEKGLNDMIQRANWSEFLLFFSSDNGPYFGTYSRKAFSLRLRSRDVTEDRLVEISYVTFTTPVVSLPPALSYIPFYLAGISHDIRVSVWTNPNEKPFRDHRS